MLLSEDALSKLDVLTQSYPLRVASQPFDKLTWVQGRYNGSKVTERIIQVAAKLMRMSNSGQYTSDYNFSLHP
jgi:hypothetical protein